MLLLFFLLLDEDTALILILFLNLLQLGLYLIRKDKGISDKIILFRTDFWLIRLVLVKFACIASLNLMLLVKLYFLS